MANFQNKVALGALVGVLALQSAPAKADRWYEWQHVTTDQGCVANIFFENDPSELAEDWRVFHWTGNCSPGAPINGTGALEIHSMSYEGATVQTLSGTMTGGYFQGAVKSGFYAVDDKGNWSSSSPEWAIETSQYKKGCVVQEEGECETSRADIAPARLYRHALFRDTKATPAAPAPKFADTVGQAPKFTPWAGQYHPIYKDYPINDALPAADWITEKTVEGCVFYEVIGLSTDAEYQQTLKRSKLTMHWSGPCEPGEPIDGFGTLRSDNVVSGIRISDEKTGRIKKGYWEGPVKSVNLTSNKSATIEYRGGCYMWKNDDGTPYMAEKYCRPINLTGQ